VNAWLQPKDQMFYSTKSTSGFAVSIQPAFKLSRHVAIAADIGYKTKGWLFGNPYLDANFSSSIYLRISTN
jgi:hypothetical protein